MQLKLPLVTVIIRLLLFIISISLSRFFLPFSSLSALKAVSSLGHNNLSFWGICRRDFVETHWSSNPFRLFRGGQANFSSFWHFFRPRIFKLLRDEKTLFNVEFDSLLENDKFMNMCSLFVFPRFPFARDCWWCLNASHSSWWSETTEISANW